ncbi:unnamed protein product [Closterium sp. Naga37s-1]|nr:unnamed protein product [Closterium sp. Naga37s-1]
MGAAEEYEEHGGGDGSAEENGSAADGGGGDGGAMEREEMQLYSEASAFQGAAVVAMIERHDEDIGEEQKILEITMEDGVTMSLALDSGERRLNELGYRQELKRSLHFPQLYATGISMMSVFAGVVPMYAQGFNDGGPAGLIWYWWITAVAVHLIALSMAEISSSFPTAGSLYFWAAALAGPKWGPLASFITGWMDFLGLAVCGANPYSFLITLLVSQYSLYGYDCVAHLAEETKKADRTAPLAIMSSLTTVTVLAWLLVVVLTWSIQDPAHLFAAESATGGMQPVVQIMWDVFYTRYGSGLGAQVFTVVICISFFGATLSCQLGASRVAYALARDGGLPFSSLWRRLAPNRVPVWALTLSVLVGLLFLLPVLASSTLFFALASISTIAWISAYSVPILFRTVQEEKNFPPGPFYLPNYIGFTAGKLVHVVALLWVLYTLVVKKDEDAGDGGDGGAYVSKEELVSVMEWKLTRGKWRPRLLDFIKQLDPTAVQTASSRAFAALAPYTLTTPGGSESASEARSEAGVEASLKAAVTELSSLKGVGAATASAVLAALAPQVAPFMSDEAMVAALGDSKDYSLRRYLVFAKAMREKASELNQLADKGAQAGATDSSSVEAEVQAEQNFAGLAAV